MRDPERGHIEGVTFKTIRAAATPLRVELEGFDKTHAVEDVLFQDVRSPTESRFFRPTCKGTPLCEAFVSGRSSHVIQGDFGRGIKESRDRGAPVLRANAPRPPPAGYRTASTFCRQAGHGASYAVGLPGHRSACRILHGPCDRIGRAPGERSIQQRIEARRFPSVFQAWNPVQNVHDESPLHTLARHDLVWHDPQFFRLKWNNERIGLADGFSPESIKMAKAFRRRLMALNPNLILIAEIRYRDAHKSYLPDGHPWWLRDKRGRMVPGWDEGGFLCLDFQNPEFRRQVARQAKAAVASGAVDGIMLDWWSDDAGRVALAKEVREAVGENALIICNANDHITPRTAQYVNGYFMECYRSQTGEDWKRIADTLAWAEKNLRSPRVNCLETWFHKSRNDLHLMRATTTLALTLSNGYCLFSDPDPLPTPDHLHDWYPFWNKSLGRPLAAGASAADGTVRREFDGGTVVYNPMGNKCVDLAFPHARTSVATGRTAREHQLAGPDGDIFCCQRTRNSHDRSPATQGYGHAPAHRIAFCSVFPAGRRGDGGRHGVGAGLCRRAIVRARPVRCKVHAMGIQLRPRRTRPPARRLLGEAVAEGRGRFSGNEALGANVVRVHLQLSAFMTGPEKMNEASLDRLGRLVAVAEQIGLYLDITGLGCYRKKDVPEVVRQPLREGPLGGAGPLLGGRGPAVAPRARPSFVTT